VQRQANARLTLALRGDRAVTASLEAMKELTLAADGTAVRAAAHGDEPVLLRDAPSGEAVAVLLPIAVYRALTEALGDELPDSEVEAVSRSPRIARILERARQSGHVDAADAWRELGLPHR
jgi:hypothetical protein